MKNEFAKVVDARHELGIEGVKEYSGRAQRALWAVELPDEYWVGCWPQRRHAEVVARMLNAAARTKAMAARVEVSHGK